jgi:hypothetical protein
MANKPAGKKQPRGPSREILEALLDGLKNIDSLLPATHLTSPVEDHNDENKTGREEQKSVGDSASDASEVNEGEHDEEEDISEEEYDYGESTSMESEEIEVAVDELVSDLNDMRGHRRQAASLSDLFSVLFGKSSETVSVASDLGDAINGYFGQLLEEHIDQAQRCITELIDFVSSRMEQWNQ